MLTTPNHLLDLHVVGKNLQVDLLHHLPCNRGEADQLVVPQIVLLKIGVRFVFFQSSGTSLQIAMTFKDNREWPRNDVNQLPQHSTVYPMMPYGLGYIQFKYLLT